MLVNETDENAFLLMQSRETDRIVVYFSGLKQPNFNGYRQLANIPINKLFIRDPGNTWYNDTIPGVADGADALAEKLREVLAPYPIDKRTFAGNSMGGYAAMLFASLVGAGRVVAISPQTMLDIGLPRSPHEAANIRYPRISSLLGNNSLTQIEVFSSADDIEDMVSVADIGSFPNVRIHAVANSHHNVQFATFSRLGVLKKFWSESLFCECPDFGLPLSSVWKDKNAMTLAKDVILHKRQKRRGLAIVAAKELVARKPLWGAALLEAGVISHDRKRFEQALKYLTKANYVNTNDPRFPLALGRVHLALNDNENAIKWFSRAVELPIHPERSNHYVTLIELLLEAGRKQEARHRLEEAGKLFDTDLKFRKLQVQLPA